MTTVMITGCDSGLGEEFALQYAAKGDRVIATCLEPGKLMARHDFGANVQVLKLDVTNANEISSLSEELCSEKIDILINNAGIPGPHLSLADTDLDLWRRTLEVNVIGSFAVTAAFVDHVARSDQKLIAFLSSRMGSISLNNSGASYAYRSSKAGLNMVMKSFAIDLAAREICVLGVHPGNVPFAGDTGLAASASVTRMRELFREAGPHQTGTFYNYNGQILPW